MINNNRRQHPRIKKPLTMKFCLVEAGSKKWDITTIDDISTGGLKFTAQGDLILADKTIRLQIRIPELLPVLLELEAVVISAALGSNSKFRDVRAKFIDLSDENKEHLSIVEKIINSQELKNNK